MKLIACGKTDTGRHRSNNQDCCYTDETLGLFIVADGMGGHAAGEIASAMAVQTIRDHLTPLLIEEHSLPKLTSELKDALQSANQTIAQAANNNPVWQGMGTTLTVLLLRSGQALLAHVGDSRLYLWRDNLLDQLSEDHSLVAEQVRLGIITAERAESSDLRNMLLQAVGITEELDIFERQRPLQVGDRFLLCSDGLTNMLNDTEIKQILIDHPEPEAAAEVLLEQANEAGGKDNITAVLVRVEQP